MNKKLVAILLLTALLVAASAILAKPGEDSDCIRITINPSLWENPFGKEGGDEGVFLCFVSGEDSDGFFVSGEDSDVCFASGEDSD